MSRYQEIDLSNVHRFPFEERATKVSREDFTQFQPESNDFSQFFNRLPDYLAAKDFKEIVRLTKEAITNQRKILVMMGAHTIKVGLSPLIIALMERKIISCLTLNGAGVIHDFEMGMFGRTSEDVAKNLENGSFGYVTETGVQINEAIKAGANDKLGYGESVAVYMQKANAPYAKESLLVRALELGIPVTVHTAIGTETIHQHPEADGAAIGETSLRDFHILCHELTKLENGMVFLYGSAVILPEVFLKALTVVRNLGFPLQKFTSVNFDMIRHYRATENVVQRPTKTGGKGFTIIGHHEILIPLLWQAILSQG